MKSIRKYSGVWMLFVILNVLTWNLQTLAQANPSSTPSQSPTGTTTTTGGACGDICAAFDKFMKGVNDGKPCGRDNPELVKTPYTLVTKIGTTTFDGAPDQGTDHEACVKAVQEDQGWGQIGPHCMAKTRDEDAINWELGTAIAYTAATAPCALACFGNVPALPFCMVADLGAAAADIASGIQLKINGHEIEFFVNQVAPEPEPSNTSFIRVSDTPKVAFKMSRSGQVETMIVDVPLPFFLAYLEKSIPSAQAANPPSTSPTSGPTQTPAPKPTPTYSSTTSKRVENSTVADLTKNIGPAAVGAAGVGLSLSKLSAFANAAKTAKAAEAAKAAENAKWVTNPLYEGAADAAKATKAAEDAAAAAKAAKDANLAKAAEATDVLANAKTRMATAKKAYEAAEMSSKVTNNVEHELYAAKNALKEAENAAEAAKTAKATKVTLAQQLKAATELRAAKTAASATELTTATENAAKVGVKPLKEVTTIAKGVNNTTNAAKATKSAAEATKVTLAQQLKAATELRTAQKTAAGAIEGSEAAKGLTTATKDAANVGVKPLKQSAEGLNLLKNGELTTKMIVTGGDGAAGGAGAAQTASKASQLTKAGAGAKTMSKLDRGMACFSMVADAVMAGIKWKNYTQIQVNQTTECANISKLPHPDGIVPTSHLTLSDTANGLQELGNSFSIAGQGLSNEYKKLQSTIDAMKADFPGSHFSAASAGPFAPLLTSNPNREGLPSFLDKMGVDLDSLAKKMQTTNPMDALASQMDLPPGIAATLNEIQKAVNEGNVTMSGAGGMGAPPAASSAGAATALLTFGKDRSLGLQGGVLEFAGKKKDASSVDPSDIWHTGTSDSIFMIATKRFEQSRSKVELIEWTSPINRAMHGLPRTPKLAR